MPKNSQDHYERYYARNRQEWRQWLEKNHNTSPGVWVVYHKKAVTIPACHMKMLWKRPYCARERTKKIQEMEKEGLDTISILEPEDPLWNNVYF